MGTVGTRMVGEDVPTSLTTPEAPDLQALFALMCEREVAVCAMEVSSHALVMGRVDGTVFDVATFLNLGRDHLDFHADVEDYFAAKASLFTPERARLALVNLDDGHGRRLAESVTIPLRTFSAAGAEADWRAVEVTTTAHGSTFVVEGPDGLRLPAGVPLAGDFNVSNALAAIASCAEAGFDPAAVAAGIADGPGVPGRLEDIDEGQSFAVVVDYAHKPDAVEAALRTLRPLTEGRLLVVIGAGGDRDPGKRPADGGDRRAPGRRARGHRRQPPQRGARRDPRRLSWPGPATGEPRCSRWANGVRRSAPPWSWPDRATSCWSPARGTRAGRRSRAWSIPFDDRVVVREELRRL